MGSSHLTFRLVDGDREMLEHHVVRLSKEAGRRVPRSEVLRQAVIEYNEKYKNANKAK